MARRVVDQGLPLTLWARRPESLEPFSDTAASLAPTPAELGASSDVVGICVVGDIDVEDVLLRSDGVFAGMSPGGIVAIHSTVHPDTCQRVAEVADRRDIAVIDAPVSGGGLAAAAGSLLVMVGGDADAFERCRPVLETFGGVVVHLGPLGSGQLAKLINNFVFTAQISIALETFVLAESFDMDPVALGEVLGSGSGGSRALAILSASKVDLTGIRSHAPLLKKDVDLVRDVTWKKGASEPPLILGAAINTLELFGQ